MPVAAPSVAMPSVTPSTLANATAPPEPRERPRRETTGRRPVKVGAPTPADIAAPAPSRRPPSRIRRCRSDATKPSRSSARKTSSFELNALSPSTEPLGASLQSTRTSQQLLADLLMNRLFQVIDRSLADRLPEHFEDAREQCIK